MTVVAAPEHVTQTAATISTPGRDARNPLVAGVASGLLLWSAFPPAEWSWLAWVALVPLFWLVTLRGDRVRAYLSAWLGGLAFWLLAVSWVRLSDPSAWVGWIAMAFVFSLSWVGFLALCRWATLRLQIPLILAAPIVWVALEYARAYFLTGFPWYYLGHSQFRALPVIQIADITGALGISFVMAIVNALVVDILTLPIFVRTASGRRLSRRLNVRLCAVTLLVGSTLGYGFFRVATAKFRAGPRLALIQSNIEQSHKMSGDPFKIVGEFEKLTARAVSSGDRPELIVWPETAYPFGYITIDPNVAADTLANQVRSIAKKLAVADWVEKRKDVSDHLSRWTDRLGVPMLIGTSLYDHQPGGLNKFNSAILFEPTRGLVGMYHKMHLVPFGEYIPFFDALPWLTYLTPFRGEKVPSLSFGKEPRVLVVGPYALAISICFEDTVPQVIARFFDPRANQPRPDVLINLSNDGWFHDSSELDVHLAIGVFRAVEHRVPLARAVNTGLSAVVDGNGEIRATLPKEVDDVLKLTIPLDDRTSLYSRWGDWLPLSCLAVTIGLVPIGIIRKPR